ncbi:MAG TPA: S-methyl-5-thioribose kinase [Aestuariivirgaceae bacterium]|jgi:5-methylthioribose kinase
MKPIELPQGYKPHDALSLRDYLGSVPHIAKRLGGPPSTWVVDEVGDGNLNLVFKVHGPLSGVAVKQALPYVRLVGESWPLPLTRSHYEYLALEEERRLAEGLVPKVFHHDETLALIVMELLEPHIIMRRGMVAATRYEHFADHISTFMARTLYFTSDLALSADQKKTMIGAFSGNTALCKITEDLIFTEPYMVAANNRWTSPELDRLAAEFRNDVILKGAISRLKLKFLSSPEALIHGDLHTGSVMVTAEETRVIDPEFAFMGPMGFDVGAMIGNFLLNYFAQDGHEDTPGAREDYREWVLQTTEQIWTGFESKFLELWRTHQTGDAFPASLFSGPLDAVQLEAERAAYMRNLFADTVGFAAAKMIRRILGLAHNIDFEWIKNKTMRAKCEARALKLARSMMTSARSFNSIASICALARGLRNWQPELG